MFVSYFGPAMKRSTGLWILLLAIVFQAPRLATSTSIPCGTIYSGEKFSGTGLPINDGDQSVDFLEDIRASNISTSWSQIGSFDISPGCRLEVCKESYLDGTCQTFDSSSLTNRSYQNFLGQVKSFACGCEKQCKCTDPHIKKTTCGRAYLQGGCTSCNALYIDLKPGRNPVLAEGYSDKIQSIRLRGGCNLTAYALPGFTGNETFINQEVVENFQGHVSSYACFCDDSQYQPRQLPPRPASYPALVNLPSSMDQMMQMLRSKMFTRHPGLLAARNSYKNGRSHKNAYILLLGSTGAGKSSAINLLFDNPNITKVGDAVSTTKDIHELRINVPIDELGITNSELRIIDTPGLGDTAGLAEDAKFLANLDTYLSDHAELKDRIPNVVLIFHKFTDNRFKGDGANFVKMLRGLDLFTERITDSDYSNVIFVFSLFCHADAETKRRPQNRIEMFREVIEEYTLFPKPTNIVLAENKPEQNNLPMFNGYWQLPNKEYYPKNLFQKLELVTEKSNDKIGLGVFRTAFRDSENIHVEPNTFKMASPNSDLVSKYLGILGEADFGFEETEVSQILTETWEQKLDAGLREKFPFALAYLKKSLHIRDIKTFRNVPKTSENIIKLLTSIRHDDATKLLLETGLNITAPTFPHNTIAGYSYDVFQDLPLPFSPFQLGDVQQSDIGYMIPNSLSCTLNPSSLQQFIVLENQGQYLEKRLESLGIEGTYPVQKFTGKLLPGYNIRPESFRDNGCSITAAKDFRVFQFELNGKLPLCTEFQAMVEALSPFNASDPENVNQWQTFFGKYGSHVVKSVYGGGSIRIDLSSNKTLDLSFVEAIFDIVRLAEDLSYGDTESQTYSDSLANNHTEGITRVMRFLGGSTSHKNTDLGKISITRANRLLNKWRKSLRFHPVMLPNEMKLVPISQIVKRLGRNYTLEIDKATKLLFQSELNSLASSGNINTGPGQERYYTPFLDQVQQQSSKLQEMMIAMQNSTLENVNKEAELEAKRLEFEQAQEEANRKFMLEIQETQQNQTAELAKLMMQLEAEKQEAQRKDTELRHALEAQRLLAEQRADERMAEIEALRLKDQKRAQKRHQQNLQEAREKTKQLIAKFEEEKREAEQKAREVEQQLESERLKMVEWARDWQSQIDSEKEAAKRKQKMLLEAFNAELAKREEQAALERHRIEQQFIREREQFAKQQEMFQRSISGSAPSQSWSLDGLKKIWAIGKQVVGGIGKFVSGCLRGGTKILMANGLEKNRGVEGWRCGTR